MNNYLPEDVLSDYSNLRVEDFINQQVEQGKLSLESLSWEETLVALGSEQNEGEP